MGAGGPPERKVAYYAKFVELLKNYPTCLVVGADFVGSAQMATIRKKLRPLGATLLMGKNTLMRRALREESENMPELAELLPYIVYNMGLVFCKEDSLSAVADVLKAERVGAAAKAGTFAPCDVIVPEGDTGLDPSQTTFMQALNIATKINKGQVMIIKDVELLKAGQKVGSSEAALLQKLGIKPFSYGLEIQAVYEGGAVYEPKVLALGEKDVMKAFASGVAEVAKVSLGLGFPTLAAFPHVVHNAYKNVMSIALATDYTFSQVEKLKTLLNDPAALAKLSAAASAAKAPAAAAAAAPAAGKKEEKKKEEPKEESDEEMGMGLFD